MMDKTELSAHLGMCFLIFWCVLVFSDCAIMGADVNDLRPTFEHHYQLWKAHCQEVAFSSKASDRLSSADYRAIVNLGPTVIPYIVEKAEQDKDFIWIGWAWGEITRVVPDPKINPWAQESILSWWQGGKKQADARFESLYSKWSNLKAQGLSVEADHVRQTIRALGIVVLPRMIEKLHAGDTSVLQIIRDMMDSAANISGENTAEQAKSCLTWWDTNKEKWLIPFPNKKPVANAGQDQIVAASNIVQLDGSASSDPDEDKLTYKWIQIAGPAVALSDDTIVKPSFTAPQVQKQIVLTFQLTVDDGSPKKAIASCESGQSDPDTINVIVNPKD